MSDVEDEMPGDAGEDEFAGLPEVGVSVHRLLVFELLSVRCMQLAAPAARLLQHNSTSTWSSRFSSWIGCVGRCYMLMLSTGTG